MFNPFSHQAEGDFFKYPVKTPMETAIITGGTGLIGRSLSKFLESRGFQVIILTRNPKDHRSSSPGISYAAWNTEQESVNEQAFSVAKYVIHLAGAGVADRPWTEKRKKEIAESRIRSSDLLIRAMTQIPNQIVSVVSASAIGWYSPRLSGQAVETDPPDSGFLGETCRLWENAILPVQSLGKRLVILRTGIVLSKDGGAFPEFAKPVRYGIAGVLGDGKQIISWIHMEDICRIYAEAMTNPSWSGIYNAVAPNPVSNRTFTLELAKKMKGSYFIQMPVPHFILRLKLGDRSEEVLKSSNVSSKKLKEQGFQFIYPTIDAAFQDLASR
jgi:uncharacterized protein